MSLLWYWIYFCVVFLLSTPCVLITYDMVTRCRLSANLTTQLLSEGYTIGYKGSCFPDTSNNTQEKNSGKICHYFTAKATEGNVEPTFSREQTYCLWRSWQSFQDTKHLHICTEFPKFCWVFGISMPSCMSQVYVLPKCKIWQPFLLHTAPTVCYIPIFAVRYFWEMLQFDFSFI